MKPYTKQWVRHMARLHIPDAQRVRHIFPRAYCIAKPAPSCAVFATPSMDAEPHMQTDDYSAYHTVYRNVLQVHPGDWCSIGYVVSNIGGEQWAFIEGVIPK